MSTGHLALLRITVRLPGRTPLGGGYWWAMSQENVNAARRLRLTAFGVASVLGVCLAAVLFAAPAMAGRPTPGALYYGLRATDQYPRVEELIPPSAELRVARSGRRLAAAEVTLLCGRGRSLDELVVRLSFRRNPAAVVRRDGSFSFPAVGLSDTERRVRLWLSGRFVSAQYARLFYRVRNPRDCPPTHERYPDLSPTALYRDGQAPFSGCRSQRAGTLLRTDTARVFQQLVIDEFTSFVTHVYACLYAIPHRRVDLGRNYDDARVRAPRLAGAFVAYMWGALRVLDLNDPNSLRIVDPTPGFPKPAWGADLRDLVLKQTGAIAWTVDRYDGGELWALDAAGLRVIEPGPNQIPDIWLERDAPGLRLLDSGPDLDLESLALNGSTLTWTNAGTTRTATLD